jgi:O-antigen/teichoic acid export membrane protein
VFREKTRGFAERVARYRSDVSHTLSVEVVTLVSLAVMFPLIVRNLGDEQYGKYTALYLVFGFAALWVSSAPGSAMVQLILQQHNDSQILLRLARRQALVCAGPVAVIATAVTTSLYGRSALIAMPFLLADFLLSALANFNLSVVFAITGVGATARVRMLQPITRAAGVAVLAMTGVLSLGTLIGVNVFAAAVLFVMSARARSRARQAPDAAVPTARSLFRYSTYYAASMSTNEMQNEGENLVMASTRPAAELGQYAAAYRIVSLTLIPCNAVVAAANRWFMVRDDRSGAQLRRTVRLAVPTALYGLAAAVGILLGRGIIQWVVGAEFDDASTIAVWLCLLPLLHGLADLPPIGLLGLGRNRERMIMGLATAAISLAGYLVLVPRLGWRGGVLGTYCSEVVSLVAGFWCLRHYQQRADREACLLPSSDVPLANVTSTDTGLTDLRSTDVDGTAAEPS